MNGKQPGAPERLAQALIEITGLLNPPFTS